MTRVLTTAVVGASLFGLATAAACDVEPPPAGGCEDGDTKDADDGCNTCTCEDGQWSCTEIGCYDPCADLECGDACSDCPPGEPECDEEPVVKACDPAGQCTAEGTFTCEGECEDAGEDQAMCYDPCADLECGEACSVCHPDDADCVETAVLKACDPEGECVATDTFACDYEDECEDGDTKDAEDGCNTCVCEDGAWACTEIACE